MENYVANNFANQWKWLGFFLFQKFRGASALDNWLFLLCSQVLDVQVQIDDVDDDDLDSLEGWVSVLIHLT